MSDVLLFLIWYLLAGGFVAIIFNRENNPNKPITQAIVFRMVYNWPIVIVAYVVLHIISYMEVYDDDDDDDGEPIAEYEADYVERKE